MFLVHFEWEKHLRTLSEHSEHFLRFLVDLKLLHGVKQCFSSNSERQLNYLSLICHSKALFNAMEELQIDEKSEEMLRLL